MPGPPDGRDWGSESASGGPGDATLGPASPEGGGSSDGADTATRRGVLAGAVALGTGLAGCGRVIGSSGGEGPVSVIAAGSLQRALENGLRERTSVPVTLEAHGSATVARLVAEGQRDPDVVALADPALLERVLRSPWYAVFASNAMVLAYRNDSDIGRRLASAVRWFAPLLDDGITVGRTDPDLDPLGYRTLFVLSLAAAHYDRPGLAEAVLERSRTYPETSLLTRLETGAVDAAFVYENMAVQRDLGYRSLPPAIDLSSRAHREQYRTTAYELPGGGTVRGDVIAYAATLRRNARRPRRVFRRLIDATALGDGGFTVPARYPVWEGDVPPALA